MSDTTKDHLSIVIVGHVDAGKSTTTGHLLFKLGGVPKRDLEKLQAEADALGKGSFAFAFFMDKNKDERERGVTISCTTKEFFTDSKHYTIIDAPGHRDFVKNMISGAAQADVALLMVPANKGGFETAIQKGDHKTGQIQGQTRQHARICKLLGVEQLIVGINKMDSADYSEERYNEIKGEVSKMLTSIGYKTERVPFIPFSGFKGENLVEEAKEQMPWYKGFSVKTPKGEITGHTLVDALDRVARAPKLDLTSAPMMPVSDILKIPGVGSVITGRVERGIFKKDQMVKFLPSGAVGKVFTMEMHHKTYEQAQQGQNVGINVKGLSKENMPRRGDVMVLDDPSKYDNKYGEVTSFRALVVVQEHPGQLTGAKDGKGGFSPLVHVRTNKVPCQMTTIHWKTGKKTGGEKMEDPPFLESGESAEVTFVPRKPLYATDFGYCKGLGRAAVMDSNQLVMLGKISAVEYKPVKSLK